MKINHNNFLKLAFNIAKINLGKTNFNPSVGCIIVKNNSVISSGITSAQGRPHAEYNALRLNKNYKLSDLYVTMEPCTHFGKTPPCTDLIIKKGIKRVYFSFKDTDTRTANKSFKILKDKKIKVYIKKIKKFSDFYKSYYLIKRKLAPYIDAKIAFSKDLITINKNSKWITNNLSRKRAHLIRSEYDVVVSTSKSVNADNSLLNCRLDGFDKNKPDLIIIDLNLKIKKNLSFYKNLKKRKVFIVTSSENSKKISYLKKKGIKVIRIKALSKKDDFKDLFMTLKKIGYNRILVETGLIFLNELIKNKLIYNIFIFKSSNMLGKNGQNNTTNDFFKRINFRNKIKVNLNNDKLYKVKIK